MNRRIEKSNQWLIDRKSSTFSDVIQFVFVAFNHIDEISYRFLFIDRDRLEVTHQMLTKLYQFLISY